MITIEVLAVVKVVVVEMSLKWVCCGDSFGGTLDDVIIRRLTY